MMILASLLFVAAQVVPPAERPDPMLLGPAVGQPLLPFEAKDQNGIVRTFGSLKGPNGLVLVFFRSADWCPFCKAQLVELQSQLEGFKKRGLSVAALSYDSVDALKDFSTRRGITYPLLSDPDSKIIRAFGLINEVDYPPSNQFHGIPFPGTFVTDAKGIIRSKDFERNYQERRTASSFLVAQGDRPAASVKEVQNDQFALRTSISNAQAAPGHRLTLVLDFGMGPHMHAYAPGVTGYRPLALKVADNPLIKTHGVIYPAAKPYTFKPLKETVPVFEGQFRVTQDVTIVGPARPAPGAAPIPPPSQVEIAGTLEYQVCSDTLCHAPASMPVSWTIRLMPLDRERVPEALRKKAGAIPQNP